MRVMFLSGSILWSDHDYSGPCDFRIVIKKKFRSSLIYCALLFLHYFSLFLISSYSLLRLLALLYTEDSIFYESLH